LLVILSLFCVSFLGSKKSKTSVLFFLCFDDKGFVCVTKFIESFKFSPLKNVRFAFVGVGGFVKIAPPIKSN